VPKEAPRTPVPSSFFDPLKGAANYAEHLEEMAYCEELVSTASFSTSTTTALRHDAVAESDRVGAQPKDQEK
jgi:hypothetical protein